MKKSPVYLTSTGYDLAMKILYGKEYFQLYAGVAELIPNNVSVVDVCCGTCRLYRNLLRKRSSQYLGLDLNRKFIMAAQNRGINAKLFNVLLEDIPSGDYVVMCSSLYHFQNVEDDIFDKLIAAACKAVIISEPVKHISNQLFSLFKPLANYLSNPGFGEYHYRYNLQYFKAFAKRHGASQFISHPSKRNAIAVFRKN